MANQNAIDKVADTLSTKALYSSNKAERLMAIQGLARLVLDSSKAADTLSTIAQYGSDPELRRAALAALSGEY